MAEEMAADTSGVETEASEQTTDSTVVESSEDVIEIDGMTPVTDDELSGTPDEEETKEEEETEGQEEEETSTESKEAATSESEEDTTETKSEEEEVQTEEEEEEVKHPKGFVPVAAVHEARGEIRYLKEQVASLIEKVSAGVQEPVKPAAPVVPPEFVDFVELSIKDLEELVLEDPAEAILYTHKLQSFKTHQNTQASVAEALENAERQSQIVVNAAYSRMEEAVPGLFDESSTAGADLATFAKEIGFGTDIFYLTNPSTKIIPPGQTDPVALGEGAASLVELLAGVRTTLDKQNAAPTEEAIREQLTKEITETVQKELLEKFKTDSPNAFKSLGSATGTEQGDSVPASQMLSMEDFGKLSDKDREAYLAGT